MAISPTVQEHQRRLLLQEQDNLTPDQISFNQKFGKLAFAQINARFPRLQEYIVTFKVVESDIEKRFGMAAFVVRKGEDVVYIPVILYEGAITSLEMVYNKQEDTLVPMVKGEVDRILAANTLGDPSIVRKKVQTEDTKQLFTNMFRPPTSSSFGFASGSGVENLPNEAKNALADYFESRPEMLAKVAEFYPVKALATKLAMVKEASEQEEDSPVVLRFDQLTKEAREALSSDDKQEMLQRGYVVKVPEGERTKAINAAKLPVELVTRLDLVEKPHTTDLYGKGYLLYLNGSDISLEKCLVIRDKIYTKKGEVASACRQMVLSNFMDGIEAKDLEEFGAKSPEDLSPPGQSYPRNRLTVAYLTKSSWNAATPSQYLGNWTKRTIGRDVFLDAERGSASIGFVTYLNRGYVKASSDQTLYPSMARVFEVDRDETSYVDSLQGLYSLIMRTSERLRLLDDGVDLSLSDSTTKKTAKFRDEADLVEHLVTQYDLSKEAADQLLRDKDILLMSKTAFITDSQVETAEAQNQPRQSLLMPGQAQPQAQQPYEVDDELIDATAELGDEDMMDTGMLASLAGNEDIKGLLVDMSPTFEESLTTLGKAILVFTANQEEIEEYYGEEQFTTLLGRIRKVFKLLGEILDGLKSYINMN